MKTDFSFIRDRSIIGVSVAPYWPRPKGNPNSWQPSVCVCVCVCVCFIALLPWLVQRSLAPATMSLKNQLYMWYSECTSAFVS